MIVNPAARLSIVAYKPRAGKENDLLSLAKEHVPFLQSLGFVTERAPVLAKASDGTIVEVFEWAEGGLEKAHAHPGVSELWIRYAQTCDYVPLSTLEETSMIFANFVPVD